MRPSIVLLLLIWTGAVFPGDRIHAQVNMGWIAVYDGPETSDQRSEATALVLDGQGNIYVTGRTWDGDRNWDYATVKYDYNGRLLWVAYYNGPANGSDEPRAMAVDAEGFVYVTGQSLGVDSVTEYATLKYDPDGRLLWVARYHGPGYGNDSAQAIALDLDGNVYVTGVSWGVDTFQDYATIKYDTNGRQLWAARYDGAADRDEARAIAVDGDGNVYVTGASWGIGTLQDYATVKYNADGTLLWDDRYNGPGNLTDEPRALAVDALGNVYVTGISWGGVATQYDYATIKYDSDGDRLWVTRYDGPGHDIDGANALAVDGQGYVYVTGYSGDGGFDYATVKYDTAGQEVWVARYDGPSHNTDIALALALDALGNVYVTGYSAGLGRPADYATVKYDTKGEQVWVARFGGPGVDWNEARALAVDNNGQVYVGGYGCARRLTGDPSDLPYCGGEEYSYITIQYTQDESALPNHPSKSSVRDRIP